MDSKKNGLAKLFEDLPLSSKKKDIKIGVICGGISSEREISLKTGQGIYSALTELGYNADFIDFKGEDISLFKKIDIAFLALHGKYGEDGTVQGVLELFKIPYTGSGILASSLAIDKIYSKKIFKLENINTPDYISIENEKDDVLKKKIKEVNDKIAYPVVVKPAREGSTIGITIADNESDVISAIDFARIYDNKILIEKYIKGRQLTVSILGGNPVALPIVEVVPKSGFYDFKSKYTTGLTEYIVPAKINKDLSHAVQEISLKTHKSLGCHGISRVDLILGEEGEIFVLEINTMPGMTETSLVPKAAAAAGIDFKKLVEIILNSSTLKQ
ncbi:MAG: D-alanine--D-alanine ligase [Actinomycetota bacterium]|nr:D-alanine--D-alanine ligase [Actinomycetota bacterium]